MGVVLLKIARVFYFLFASAFALYIGNVARMQDKWWISRAINWIPQDYKRSESY